MNRTNLSWLLFVGLASCGPFVPVIDLRAVAPDVLDASGRVRVVTIDQRAPEVERFIGAITTYSVKSKLWDPPATRGNALAQARVKCVELGGNALINVTFDAQGTDPLGTNAWESVTCSCDVVVLKFLKESVPAEAHGNGR